MKKIILCVVAVYSLFDAGAQHFSPTLLKNPDGPWAYGYGTVGGQFNAFPQQIGGENNTDVAWLREIPQTEVVAVQSVAQHLDAMPIPESANNTVPIHQNDILMQCGDTSDHLSIIRFTAPDAGTYQVKVTFTAIHPGAKKWQSWVYTNAKSEEGRVYEFTPAGFKEIFTESLNGSAGRATFERTLKLEANEIIDFETGNGGDGFENDLIKAEISIDKI